MTSSPPSAPADILTSVVGLVEARSGLRFGEGRQSELAIKVSRAFAESGCQSWEAYSAALMSGANSPTFEHLIEALVVGETYFFRHRPYFDLLERDVLPRLIAERAATRQLRIWSAGCATGEEAYSLAILTWRLLPDFTGWQVSILGTDLNSRFLKQAECGLFSDWSMRGTDEAFRSTYFTREGVRYQLHPWIAARVRFARLNLAEDTYPSPASDTARLDLILCRNVLMYFSPELAQRIVERLRRALVPNGWLVVGPSDPLPGMFPGFRSHGGPDAVVYQRIGSPEARPSTAVSPNVLTWEPPEALPELVRPSLPPQPPARRQQQAGTVVAPAITAAAAAVTPAPELPADALWDTAAPDRPMDMRMVREYAAQGRLDEATAYCREITARGASSAESHYVLGVLLQATGDDAAALVAFRKALYLDRVFVPALLALATVYRHGGQHHRASKMLARAQQALSGRDDDELILADEALTVGRLRAVLDRALLDEQRGPA